MRRNSRVKLILASMVVLGSVAALFAQTRPRPAASSATTDFKVTYRTTMVMAGGQNQAIESTTMIKGARQRSETRAASGGFNTVDLLQCDLKRSIQISDSAKKYLVTQLESDEPSTTSTTPSAPPTGSPRRGGIVTYTTTTVDTGERKEMFGFTARHVTSTTVIDSSPDACNPFKQKTEVDGWYIDLNVGLNCLTSNARKSSYARPGQTCQDQTRFRREGTGRVGFPLIETVKIYRDNGQPTLTSNKEVVDLSRQPLDAALFEIPAGYTEAASSQEFYSMPSMSNPMAQAQSQTQSSDSSQVSQAAPASAGQKKPGTVLIGVAQINNKSGREVSAEGLRQRLVSQLQAANVEATELNASSQMEAEAEAKAKQCDFILYTDITALKTSKLGGVFGRVTGVDGGAKTEAKVEFKLFAVGESAPRLQSSTSAKLEGEEASAGTAIDAEARMVSSAVRKRN